MCVFFFLSFVPMWTERERARARIHDPIPHSHWLRRCATFTLKRIKLAAGEADARADLHCLLLDSLTPCVFVCVCVVFFHATPIRGWFVLFRFLVCRRPIKNIHLFFLSFVHSIHSMRSVDFLPFAFESALTLSLETLTHTHGTGKPAYTHRSTRSFRYVLCILYCSKWTVETFCAIRHVYCCFI